VSYCEECAIKDREISILKCRLDEKYKIDKVRAEFQKSGYTRLGHAVVAAKKNMIKKLSFFEDVERLIDDFEKEMKELK
jgi:hypothetical protein